MLRRRTSDTLQREFEGVRGNIIKLGVQKLYALEMDAAVVSNNSKNLI